MTKKKRIELLEKRIAELERRISDLEARPQIHWAQPATYEPVPAPQYYHWQPYHPTTADQLPKLPQIIASTLRDAMLKVSI